MPRKLSKASSKFVWTKEKYIDWIARGKETGIAPLRVLAKGFEAKDGYNIREFESWTPAKLRRIREYAHRVALLVGQPKKLQFERDKKKLKMLQDNLHGGIGGRFKVAFVPSTYPALTVKEAKANREQVKVIDGGLAFKKPGAYEERLVFFDKKKLVVDPVREIERVKAMIPGALTYSVAVEENRTLSYRLGGRRIIELILKWMEQYDGVKPLPHGSGNSGDNPKHHKWDQWLNGLYGYIFKKQDIAKVGKLINEGLQAARERKRIRDNFMKRKGRK